MANNNKRYKELSRTLTNAIIADGIIFVLYLIFSGFNIIWLKVITTILALGLSGLCLYVLYISKELLRQRSLWITVSAASIIVCTLFSLILNFP